MRHLLRPLCVAAGLVLLPFGAQAFEVFGEDASISEGAAPFTSLNQGYVLPEFKGYSLAMPYSSSGDSAGMHYSDYGNAIPIPGPGISQPTPAWASSPFFRQ
jgi:hypothetical protein